MKNTIFAILMVWLLTGCSAPVQDDFIGRSMDVAKQQAVLMAEYLNKYPDRLPRTYNPSLDSIITSNSKWWCSGFFPGVLWYVYEHHNDENLKQLAETYQARVEKEKYNTYDHDIGFQIYCSFGNAFRLTKDETYKDVILTAAHSATKRFNESIGLIKSWDSRPNKWQYPVIIDNMMNLELLMRGFHLTGDSLYYHVAVNHADSTLKHHFRPDYSSYHVVSYDTLSGLPHAKNTHQGAFDESIWARGQVWGLYGYVVMYRETGYERYLDQAVNIANLLIDHPNMPEDKIPYWDFSAKEIPNTNRDASAAAIMASALIELSGYVDTSLKEKYLSVAEIQLKTLSTPEYLAEPGSNGFFILKRGVGHLPAGSEVDVPLTYADYYFVEALLRFKRL
ncbi:MAG: glycoside hydrolase family 88 protein [Cyclobacteriaceae bacterium]|nr:glycoside hydrolase family 88 protein [Cyclobacteriaceae bacterium]